MNRALSELPLSEPRVNVENSVPDRFREDELRLAARVDVPVLITAGDSDRRDIYARLIHATGESVGGPFVKFCKNGRPRAHVEGSEPAASSDACDHVLLRQLFEHARGGTLFVDDITTLTAEAQQQLLSLLEERRASPSSTVQLFRRHVRVIAGSSRHLGCDWAAGEFNEQLFYRLNIIHFVLMH